MFTNDYLQRLYDAEERCKYFIYGATLHVDGDRLRLLYSEGTEGSSISADGIGVDVRRSFVDGTFQEDELIDLTKEMKLRVGNPHVKFLLTMIGTAREAQKRADGTYNRLSDVALADYVIRMYGMYALRFHGFRRAWRTEGVLIDPSDHFRADTVNRLFANIGEQPGRKPYVGSDRTTPNKILNSILKPITIFGKILLYGVAVYNHRAFVHRLRHHVDDFDYFPARLLSKNQHRLKWCPTSATPLEQPPAKRRCTVRPPVSVLPQRSSPELGGAGRLCGDDSVSAAGGRSEPSAGGPSAGGRSAGGPSAGGPSAAGPSAAGPSAAGPSEASEIVGIIDTESVTTSRGSSRRQSYAFTDEQYRLMIKFAVDRYKVIKNHREWMALAKKCRELEERRR